MSDYLIHYNHNHDALGRFTSGVGSAARGVGNLTTRKLKSSKRLAKKSNLTENESITRNKKAKQIKVKKANEVVANNKEKGSKSNNTKLSDADRRRLVESGSLKEVTKNKDKLSNRELETAINRLQKEKITRMDLDKKLSDLNSPANEKVKKSGMQRIQETGDALNKFATAADSAVKAYNVMAKIHNTRNPQDKWPIVGQKEEHKTSEKMMKTIMTASAAEVWANRSKMTSGEYNKATQRLKNDQDVQAYMKKEQEERISKIPITNESNKERKKKKSYYYDSEGRRYDWY